MRKFLILLLLLPALAAAQVKQRAIILPSQETAPTVASGDAAIYFDDATSGVVIDGDDVEGFGPAASGVSLGTPSVPWFAAYAEGFVSGGAALSGNATTAYISTDEGNRLVIDSTAVKPATDGTMGLGTAAAKWAQIRANSAILTDVVEGNYFIADPTYGSIQFSFLDYEEDYGLQFSANELLLWADGNIVFRSTGGSTEFPNGIAAANSSVIWYGPNDFTYGSDWSVGGNGLYITTTGNYPTCYIHLRGLPNSSNDNIKVNYSISQPSAGQTVVVNIVGLDMTSSGANGPTIIHQENSSFSPPSGASHGIWTWSKGEKLVLTEQRYYISVQVQGTNTLDYFRLFGVGVLTPKRAY